MNTTEFLPLRRAVAATALAVAMLVPLAAPAAISAGTQFSGVISQDINTKNAQVGDPFTINNVSSTDNNITGAVIYGHVAEVSRASQGRKAALLLALDKLKTRSGTSYALNGRVLSMQANTKSNALNQVAGVVAGDIVGNIAGKAIGTNAGGLLGAAGGYLYASNVKQDMTVPANSRVTVQVLSARQQARAR
jgi:hypothetical protein